MRFQHLTIGQKITAGFGAILTLVVILGLLNLFGINAIVHKAGEGI